MRLIEVDSRRVKFLWPRGERKNLEERLRQTYGANDMFWSVTQAIAEALQDNNKEKKLLHGLLSFSLSFRKANNHNLEKTAPPLKV